MYEAFFGLNEKPFSLSPDPRFLFLGRRHEQAYAMLQYGIHEQVGFSVITGEIGSGKTTLMRKVIEAIDDGVNIGIVSHTHHGMDQIIPIVLDSFGVSSDSLSQHESLHYRTFTAHLKAEYLNGRRSILVIDEAQNLSVKALEQLRLLSNINVDGHVLLQTVLIGQPELRDTLKAPELKQFAQRISVDYFLCRLTNKEALQYIDFRIQVAGGDPELFDQKAKHLIVFLAKGLPRVINNLADMALVYAFGEGLKQVTKSIVLDVLRDKERGGILPIASLEELRSAVSHARA